jgi:4,5-DOPA dioxygenase extradiol
MAARMPVVFVSHGAPDALLKAPDTVACWQEIGRRVSKPQAILAVSAHWEANVPTASLAETPATIHDFSGFSPELYRMNYSALGAPALAERAVALLSAAGMPAALHSSRGFDHGAWVPLSVMFPQADVPVTQLSLTRQDVHAHFAMGRALAPLRDEGVLIVASGSITHNFDWLDWHAANARTPMPQASAFADWMGEQLASTNLHVALGYREHPDGRAAHPTEEHLLPLFVALGSAGDDPPERYRPAFTYGALAMDAYLWGAAS